MEEDGEERMMIRGEIANMSFEELAKLKAEVGRQAYNEAVFGVRKKPQLLKRFNKNRPMEVSSKIRPQYLPSVLSSKSSLSVRRDPRFDDLCGDFNVERFKKDYSFIKGIKSKEKEELKEMLKEESNESRKEKIRFLITRMENQEREETKYDQMMEQKRQNYEERIQMLREGKKPYYQSKSTKRVLDLVDRYEKYKKEGKVEKVIKKYQQKKKRQDRKKFPGSQNDSYHNVHQNIHLIFSSTNSLLYYFHYDEYCIISLTLQSK